jgi:hypothetical protein
MTPEETENPDMTSDKITARVRALLARAERPDTPPAEAQAAAAKAA